MKKSIICTLTLLLLLTGCWDQQLLRDVTMISSIGMDKGPDGKVNYTVVGRNIQENAKKKVQILSTQGSTPREARTNIDRRIAESMTASKLRILLFSEELARSQPIYPILDVFYRDPRNALTAKLAVVQGSAQEILSNEYPDKPLVIDYSVDLIESEEEATGVNKTNIQLVCPILFDPGEDTTLPYLKAGKSDIELIGLALFDDQQMTGSLSPSESTLFLLLNNQKATTALINQKISQERTPEILNYVSINVVKSKSKMKLHVKDKDNITADIDLLLKIDVSEYPKDNFTRESEAKKMAHTLSTRLTDQAYEVIKKLQEANCDALGIGRRIIAFHHDVWNEIDWKKAYPNIKITPKVTVEIIQHGIIN